MKAFATNCLCRFHRRYAIAVREGQNPKWFSRGNIFGFTISPTVAELNEHLGKLEAFDNRSKMKVVA